MVDSHKNIVNIILDSIHNAGLEEKRTQLVD